MVWHVEAMSNCMWSWRYFLFSQKKTEELRRRRSTEAAANLSLQRSTFSCSVASRSVLLYSQDDVSLSHFIAQFHVLLQCQYDAADNPPATVADANLLLYRTQRHLVASIVSLLRSSDNRKAESTRPLQLNWIVGMQCHLYLSYCCSLIFLSNATTHS